MGYASFLLLLPHPLQINSLQMKILAPTAILFGQNRGQFWIPQNGSLDISLLTSAFPESPVMIALSPVAFSPGLPDAMIIWY